MPTPSSIAVRCVVLAAALAGTAAEAQDAVRGAQLYLQLPTVNSCVSCHGPDPSQNRNNILRAADRPTDLQQALNTVSAMGFLRQSLGDAEVADLAAYLGRVLQVAATNAPAALWPTTIEFGSFGPGDTVPAQHVELLNQGTAALALDPPQLLGTAHTQTHDCPASLPPAGRCRIELRAVATMPGATASTLRLSGNAPWLPLVVGVTSTVRSGPLGRLSIEPGSAPLDFAAVDVGTVVTRDLALVSHGTAPVTLGAATLTGPQRAAFRVDGDCARDRVLAPGERCTLRVSFAPTVALAAAATLQWRSDGGNPGTLALSGSGSGRAVAGPAPDPEPVTGGGAAGAASLLLLALLVAVISRRR